MAEFKLVQHAVFSPTRCVTCGDHVGPFIDLEVELPVYGHLYLCASNDSRPGCVQQMARLDHMVEEHLLVAAQDLISDLYADLDELMMRLRSEKTITLDEAMSYLEAK